MALLQTYSNIHRFGIKYTQDIYIIWRFFTAQISFGFFILTAAAPLLHFFLFSQSFAFLFVPSWTPMRSLALFVAILHRAAARAFSKGMSTGLWFVARRTANSGKRRCCCGGCSCCCCFHFVQYFKIINSTFVSFICCFGPPFTCQFIWLINSLPLHVHNS